MLPPLVQKVPLYSLVVLVAEGVPPPKATAAVCVPAAACCNLPGLGKVPPACQVLPLYSSVAHNAGLPPIAKPAFCVPAPAKENLAVDKVPPADHADGPPILVNSPSYANPTLPVVSKDPVISTDPVNCASPLASSK